VLVAARLPLADPSMDATSSLPLRVPLPRPARGSCSRVQLGSSELILESVRGAHSLLWSNGRNARRYVLGLAPHGELVLQLRAPSLPLRIVPREPITLVPGARVAGYVHVGLVPTLSWQDGAGPARELVVLHPDELAAEWDEANGHTLHGASPWYARFPMRNGEPRAIVPVRLANASGAPWSPPHFELELHDAELRSLRGSIVVAPRRVRCADDGVRTTVRVVERSAAPRSVPAVLA
jgi:hypothetical protein